MRLACVDTSTFIESIALVDGHKLVAERAVNRAKGHASGLHIDLDELLTEARWTLDDLEGFVCGLGPGSFTGMRVGLAAMKGFAYALDRPLYGVPTPLALLASARTPQALSLIDARRGEVYAQGHGIENPRCFTPDTLIEDFSAGPLSPPSLLIGEGALKHRDRFIEAWPSVIIPLSSAFHAPRASLLVEHIEAPVDVRAVEPIYVRRSDAEINYPDGFPSESRLFS